MNSPWFMGPVRFSTNLITPWGSMQTNPCCHRGAENYSNTQAITICNQVPVPTDSWVERVYIQVKCLAQGRTETPRQPRPATEISRSKAAGRSHRAATPACMWNIREVEKQTIVWIYNYNIILVEKEHAVTHKPITVVFVCM